MQTPSDNSRNFIKESFRPNKLLRHSDYVTVYPQRLCREVDKMEMQIHLCAKR